MLGLVINTHFLIDEFIIEKIKEFRPQIKISNDRLDTKVILCVSLKNKI